MSVDKLLKFLDENISSDDRKLFSKLNIHIKKSNTRSLNMLVSRYNIDKRKYIFPPNYSIDDNYLNYLEELIKYCSYAIEQKIDVSSLDIERFHMKSLLDLSSSSKVVEILRQLRVLNTKHLKVSVSEELIKSPLLILTTTTRKQLDVGVIEKHTYDYLNNNALLEADTSRAKYNSLLRESKNEYILDKKNASEFKPEIVKEAILDYYKAKDECFYISSETEEKVSRDVHALIRKKSSSSIKKTNMTYYLLDFLVPLIILIVTCFSFILGAFTDMGIDFLVHCLFAYTLVNVGLYVYRHGLVMGKRDEYCYKYYRNNKVKFVLFGVFVFSALGLQLLYMYLFGTGLTTSLSGIEDWLSVSFYDDTAMSLLTTFICLIIVAIVALTLKFSKYHVSEIFTFIASILLGVTLGIRGFLWEFASFRNYAISFTAIGVSLLLYLLINVNRGKVKNLVLLSFFFLDFILLIVLNNQFYLRELFFNIKSLISG